MIWRVSGKAGGEEVRVREDEAMPLRYENNTARIAGAIRAVIETRANAYGTRRKLNTCGELLFQEEVPFTLRR
jgi:hypothetical protein